MPGRRQRGFVVIAADVVALVRELPADAILLNGRIVDGSAWCMSVIPRDLRQAAEACEAALRGVYAADKVLLRLPTVAAATDTPLETVKHWVRTGLLPKVKVGRSVYIARDDLVAFVERHRNGGAA